MELSEYLSILRKHWIMILLVGLVGFAGAYAYSTSLTPKYRAVASVFVSVPSGNTVDARVEGANFVQSRIESYVELATTPYVLDPVIAQLQLDQTARSLRDSIEVTRALNTDVLEITASGEDPAGAAALANAVSTELARAVGELEGEVLPEATADPVPGAVPAVGQPTVRLTVVAQAVPPEFAYSPNTRLNAGTGLAAGLVVGALLALLRALLDTRVRTSKDVERVTEAAVLTNVRYDRRSARDPLVMRSTPLGPQAEAYRRLRTNLRFLNHAGPSGTIMVTSAMPGEGKTTTTINLAIAMAEGSSRILLIDADLRKPTVADYLGLEGSVGLTTVLIGEARADDVIQPWGDSLDVLAAGQIPPNPSELLDSPAMGQLLERLRARYDVVLLDSAPLVPVTDAAALSRYVDGTLVVVGSRSVRRHQLAEALASLAAVRARVLGLVLNKVSTKETGLTYVYGTGAGRVRKGGGRRSSARRSARQRATSAGDLTGSPKSTEEETWAPGRSADAGLAANRSSLEGLYGRQEGAGADDEASAGYRRT